MVARRPEVLYRRRLSVWWTGWCLGALVLAFPARTVLTEPMANAVGSAILVAICAGLLWTSYLVARTRVDVSPEAVEVVNPLRRYQVPPGSVAGVDVGRATLFFCAVLTLDDGRRVPVDACDLSLNTLTMELSSTERVAELEGAIRRAATSGPG